MIRWKSISHAFERLDRYVVDGVLNGLALALVALAESLKLVRLDDPRTRLGVLAAAIVAFAIWFVLRLPASFMALWGHGG